MSLSDKFPDLALETLLKFLTLQEIDKILNVDKKLKSRLDASPTNFYQSQKFLKRLKLQEIGIDVDYIVCSVAWSPDPVGSVRPQGNPNRTRIVYGTKYGTICQLDAITGEQIGDIMKSYEEVSCVSYSPDGTRIISLSRNNFIWQWDANTCKKIGMLPDNNHSIYYDVSVAYNSDCTSYFSVNISGIFLQRDTFSNKIITNVKFLTNSCECVAYSPDGQHIVVGSHYGTIHQRNVTTGEHISFSSRHNYRVTCIAYSTDGTRIVSGSQDGTICQSNAVTGKQIGNTLIDYTKCYVRCVAYRFNDKQIVSVHGNGIIRKWDAITGEKIGAPVSFDCPVIGSIALSPDATRMVLATERYRSIGDFSFPDPKIRILDI